MIIIMNKQMLVAQYTEPSEIQKSMALVIGSHEKWKKGE